MKKTKLLNLLKFLPFIIALGIIIWYILFKFFIITGQQEITYIPGDSTNKYVSAYGSEESPHLYGEGFSVMTEDYNTFKVKAPSIEVGKIDFELQYQDPYKHQNLKIGVLSSDGDYDYHNDYKEENLALFNPVFDELPAAQWEKQESGGLIFWQRQPSLYSSLADFQNNLPALNEVLTYNHQLSVPAPSQAEGLELNKSLRGSYEFWTYLFKEQDLSFDFLTQNLNQYPKLGGDIVITIYKDNKEIKTTKFKEEQKETYPDQASEEKINSLKLSDLDSGVYQIKLEASRNIITNKITSQQSHLVFSDSLELAGDNNDLYLYQGSVLDFTPINKNGEQEIEVDTENINLKSKKSVYSVTNLTSSLENKVKINIPSSGVLVQANGFLVFNNNQAFLPYYSTINWENGINQNIIDLKKYNYILANYIQPEQHNTWLHTKATLEDVQLNTKEDFITFRLNAPGLNEAEKELFISEMKIKFYAK